MLRCNGDMNVTVLYRLRLRYIHFHWLIYNLKRSWQEVTRTCLKRGCVRSFHKRQKTNGERNERANFNKIAMEVRTWKFRIIHFPSLKSPNLLKFFLSFERSRVTSIMISYLYNIRWQKLPYKMRIIQNLGTKHTCVKGIYFFLPIKEKGG